VCALILRKFNSDDSIFNSDISLILGIHIQELNLLELEFLRLMDYDIVVTEEEFEQYGEALKQFFADQKNIQDIN